MDQLNAMLGFVWGPPRPSLAGKRVLVVGGGLAGLSVAYRLRTLDADLAIVLAEPRDYCEVLWASYRAPFEEWVAKDSLIMLAPFCEDQKIEHVRSVVTGIDPASGSASLANGDSISFDACVVATGADAPWEGMGRGLDNTAAADRFEAMRAEGGRLLAAESVVIVGGGLIGTELAGDLAAYGEKEEQSGGPAVTVVHSGPHLCHASMGADAGARVKELLEDLGVTVILGEKASENEPGKVVLSDSGKELEASVVVVTTGFTSRNSFLEATLPGALDEKGWIATDDCLRIQKGGSNDGGVCENLFAFGDCSPTLPDSGSVYLRTADALARNVAAALAGDEPTAVGLPMTGGVNTIGPNAGVMYTSGFWTTWVLPFLKNYTMFLMAPRDMAGVKKEYAFAG